MSRLWTGQIAQKLSTEGKANKKHVHITLRLNTLSQTKQVLHGSCDKTISLPFVFKFLYCWLKLLNFPSFIIMCPTHSLGLHTAGVLGRSTVVGRVDSHLQSLLQIPSDPSLVWWVMLISHGWPRVCHTHMRSHTDTVIYLERRWTAGEREANIGSTMLWVTFCLDALGGCIHVDVILTHHLPKHSCRPRRFPSCPWYVLMEVASFSGIISHSARIVQE